MIQITFSRIPRLLIESPNDIEKRVEALDDWELKEGKIVKNFLFESFIESMEFVNDVAAIAEAQNHHPVITINFKNVKVSSLSFDVGRLTDRDFKLAKAIDNLHKKIDGRVPSVGELQVEDELLDEDERDAKARKRTRGPYRKSSRGGLPF